MAQEWVVAYGILEEDVAAKIHKVRRPPDHRGLHMMRVYAIHTPPAHTHTQLVQARKASGKPGTMWLPSPGKGTSSNGNGNGKKKAGAAAAKGKRKMRLDDDIPMDTGLAEAGDEGMGTLGFS